MYGGGGGGGGGIGSGKQKGKKKKRQSAGLQPMYQQCKLCDSHPNFNESLSLSHIRYSDFNIIYSNTVKMISALSRNRNMRYI